MKINFIDLKAQYAKYKDEIDEAIAKVLDSAQFIGGSELDSFESEIASFVGVKHAIGCSSGTDALLLSLMALDIKAGDEVITTPFTFIATAEVISFLGAKPVFVDIDESSYNINPALIEDAITERTKAILPVSLYGQCADMASINAIASKHNLIVIEDGCQSFGAEYQGRKSCALSTIGCTSFFPSKPLGAYGDGGAIFTDDDAVAAKMRVLLNHGQKQRYRHSLIGLNARLDAIQAAILRVKLKHFSSEVAQRVAIGQRYSDLLKDTEAVTPVVADGNSSVYAQYSIRVKDRANVVEALSRADIPTAVHYPLPLHLQEAFNSLGYREGDFAVSERVSAQILSLPMSPFLTTSEQDMVVEALKKALS